MNGSLFLFNPAMALEAVSFYELKNNYFFKTKDLAQNIQLIRKDFEDERCWKLLIDESIHYDHLFKMNGFHITVSLDPNVGRKFVVIEKISREIGDYSKEDLIELLQLIVDTKNNPSFNLSDSVCRPSKAVQFFVQKAKRMSSELCQNLNISSVRDLLKKILSTGISTSIDGQAFAQKI